MSARLVILLCITAALHAPAADWRLALPGWQYAFPRDHGSHPDFKTEWWYFTGELRDASGRRFGYQATWFRQGIRPPNARSAERSRLIVNDLPFGHCALSDISAGKFSFQQKTSRGVLGTAGFGEGEKLAWIEDWTASLSKGGGFTLAASPSPGERLELELDPAPGRPPSTIHGKDGISQKAAGEGRASHYYSATRLQTRGTLTRGGEKLAVTGTSWFDHEWASNQLTPEQSGWDWFSIHLADGSELMLYQMRLRDGTLDPHSSGTFIAADGTPRHLRRDDYRLTPGDPWTSPATKGRYPLTWQLSVPSLALDARITTPLRAQELDLKPVAYWEGLVDFTGTRAGQPASGHGYMELTGYAGDLVGLSGRK